MCYPKPGPRCSNHAFKQLLKAREEYRAQPDLNKFIHLKESEEVFDTTPRGQEVLQSNIEREKDVLKKHEMELRLKQAQNLRETQLKAIKSDDKGDQGQHELSERSNVRNNLPYTDLVPVKLNDCQFTSKPERYHDIPGLDVETSRYCEQEKYGGDCSDYYCHHVEYDYENVVLNTKEFAQGMIFAYDEENKEVSQELVDELESLGIHRDNIHNETLYGYYGAEGVYSSFEGVDDYKVRKVLEDYKKNLVGDDEIGSYTYARQEGVDTDGLSNVESVQQAVKLEGRFASNFAKSVTDATSISQQTFKLRDIDFSTAMDDVKTPYKFNAEQAREQYAGVVVKGNKGIIYLVGGYERFKAAQRNGRVNWKFLVLE